MPPPKLVSTLPDARSNLKIGVSVESAHVFVPQRSYAQTCPSGPMSTPAVDPHVRPSGSCPQPFMTVGFGFGSVPLAGSTTSACVNTLPDDSATDAHTRSASHKRSARAMAPSLEKR